MKKILPLLAALFFALAFIGCNNNVSVGLAGGTYTYSVENGGTTASATFTFDSNGSFTGSATSGSTTYNDAAGTYTVNGNTATLTGTSGGSVILTTTDGWQHFTMVFGGSSTGTFTRQ